MPSMGAVMTVRLRLSFASLTELKADWSWNSADSTASSATAYMRSAASHSAWEMTFCNFRRLAALVGLRRLQELGLGLGLAGARHVQRGLGPAEHRLVDVGIDLGKELAPS